MKQNHKHSSTVIHSYTVEEQTCIGTAAQQLRNHKNLWTGVNVGKFLLEISMRITSHCRYNMLSWCVHCSYLVSLLHLTMRASIFGRFVVPV